VRIRLTALAPLFVVPALLAQTAAEKPASPPRAFSIVGATIHPVSGPDVTPGTVVVQKLYDGTELKR